MISVLIVDDEQFVRVALRTLYDWEGNGFQIVDTAADGADALEKIREHRPDVVVTDIFMPNMDGIQLLERIKNDHSGCVTLVLSNAGDLSYVKTALKMGAEDYYLKVDYEQEEFHRVMSRIKDEVLKRKSDAHSQRNAGILSGAQIVANAFECDDWSRLLPPPATSLFCVRLAEYSSKSLDCFEKVYRPLCNIVRELFKSYPTLSLAPLSGTLLIAVDAAEAAGSAPETAKKLQGQIEVYLQARAEILHIGSRERFSSEAFRNALVRLQAHALGEPLAGEGLPSQDEIGRVKDYVEAHICSHVYLSDVARHTNMNASYLSRIFKQRTGMGFVTYVTGEKMKRAARLLEGGRYKVREVASLLGIEDQYYFNKLFKKAYHMTPTEYAAKMSSKEGIE